MSGQQQGTYDTGVPPGSMGGLVHSVDSYLNEMSSAQSGHNIVPQPRGQSLQHRAGGNDYSHQPNNTQYGGYYDYYGQQHQQQVAMDNNRYSTTGMQPQQQYQNGMYGSNEQQYGGYAYENAYSQQQQQQSYHHQAPTTPMPNRTSSANYGMGYPPQRLVDPSGPPPPPSHYGNAAGNAYSPPVASAQPYSTQDYAPVRGTPPGSPAARQSYQAASPQPPLQPPPPPVGYTSAGYSQPTASYSRPSSQDFGGNNGGTYRSDSMTTGTTAATTTTTSHRRTHSSLKNTIMTIERPKYARPSAIDTSQTGNDDDVPFVAVSPISSDDEDDDFYGGSGPSPAPAAVPAPAPVPPTNSNNDTTSYNKNNRNSSPIIGAATIVSASIVNTNNEPSSPPPTRFAVVSPRKQEGGFPHDDSDIRGEDRPQPTQRDSSMSRISVEVDVDYSIISELSEAFRRRMKRITNVREVNSSAEYPESFSGHEAIDLLQEILSNKGIPDGYCILIANALMNCTPPLFQPIRQNHKSRITNEVYDSSDKFYTFDEDDSDSDIPVGVLTSLTKCYSHGCEPGQGGCYAPRCPNKPAIFESEIMVHAGLTRRSSTKSNASIDDTKSFPHTAWAERVPRELLENTPKKERERQEAINEMIYSEEVYRGDLDILHEVIVMPLLKSNAIEQARRNQFVKEVFSNYYMLRELSDALYKDLLDLQRRYENKCVPHIGDILVDHFTYFSEPYTTYTPNVPLAEYKIKIERQRNSEFNRFMTDVESNSRMRRLAFRHFLLNPMTRMQRYPLLLEAIIKKTSEEHDDRKYLTTCKKLIQGIASRSDLQTEGVKQHVEILEISDQLTTKHGENHELELKAPHRRLYHHGDLKRRAQTIEVTEKTDIHAFVFDHLFLMTKYRKTNTGEEYRVWKRPIQLQMLFVLGNTDSPVSGGTSGSANSGTRPQLPNSASSYMLQGASGATAGGTGVVQLTLQHLGQRDGLYHFFCNSTEERYRWIKAIDDAKAALKKRQGDAVFEMRTLDDMSFRYFGSVGSTGGSGRISCSVPFVSANGEQKIVIGTDVGVYIKSLSQSNDLRRVLPSDNVTQVLMMERQHILLVLADKVLKAYSIDALDTPKAGRAPDRSGHEVAQNVNFFQVGYCNGKDLVVYKKKKSTSSVFVAMEPICDLRDPRSERLLTQRTGLFSSRGSNHSWFKTYTEFYVGAEASNIHFLKSKVSVVVESRGFEIIDPENLAVGGRNIPDSVHPEFNFIQRHTEPLKPLAMYRIQDKFLLCYNRFAFYVNNRNGSLVQRGAGKSLLCEWNGTPEHIVYQHPYIIAVDQQFIEIRHVDTGELVQIIKGENMRLTHFNGAGDVPIIHGCMSHSHKPDTQYLFHLWLTNQHQPQQRTNNSYPRR
ncbi:CNH domain-containing protein [Phascolomyces articulosus]|uniref:CNH domain-containing protein n=1 Tax=Phascolomyces articulosus TaxID=60185 RepID=A0AAD5JTE4_9FUNG|nr:CNH domain-containing protein [Phascolomyces articulosus]